MDTANKKRFWIRVLVVSGIVAVLIFGYALRSVLWPFVFAFFIAYIFNPWVDFLQNKRIPRIVAILIVLVGILLLFTFSFFLVVPQVSREVSEAAQKFPQYMQVLRERITPWIQDFLLDHPEIAKRVQDYYNTDLKQKLPGLVTPVMDFLGSMFSGVVNFLVMTLNLLLVPVLAFYILKDFPVIQEKGLDLIPPRHRERVRKRIGEVDSALSQYLRGQLTVSLALGLIYTIGLLILRVPLAIPVGILSGLANMVPYLGFILGIGASMLLSFLDNQEWQRLVWIVALYSFAQLMEGTWIGPLVMGRRTGLHPVVIMLALVIGGTLFGLMGMLLAVPFMAIATVFLKSAYEGYLSSQWYQQRLQQPGPVLVGHVAEPQQDLPEEK